MLIANVIVFQFLRSASRKKINRTILLSSLLMAVVAPIYLLSLSLLTYDIPTDGSRGARGFACTEAATQVPEYAATCPLLTATQIDDAGYMAADLWTPASVAVARVGLIVLWSICFLALVGIISSFAVFQTRQKRPDKALPKQAKGQRTPAA